MFKDFLEFSGFCKFAFSILSKVVSQLNLKTFKIFKDNLNKDLANLLKQRNKIRFYLDIIQRSFCKTVVIFL